MENIGEQLLHQKDPKLHITVPVEHEQARRKMAGEKVTQRPADKIANFLGVVEKTHMGHKDDPRVIGRIKEHYHSEHVILPENIPQSYWNLQGEIAINEGRKEDLVDAGVEIEEETVQHPDGTSGLKRIFTFPEEVKEQATRTVIANQKQSLDKWVDYLTSDDALYPMWAKYWAFRSVSKMGKLEKTEDGRSRFATREKNTVASFPVLNQRALAKTVGAMTERLEALRSPKGQQTTANLSTTLSDEKYQKLLSTEDFAKLYAQFLSEIPEYSTQGLEETRGQWVKYNQGSDPDQLVASLEGHPLEWCTADIDTARTQLEGGDFYVFYSNDPDAKPTIPRVAIRMEGGSIAEVRGIAPEQNLDPYVAPIVEAKLEEFPDGKAYQKKVADMKHLTEIDHKMQAGTPLDASDLIFLYELDSPIQGFGYSRDPRIEELRNQRNLEADMPVVFGCEPSQIAHSASELRSNTTAYVGRLVPGIFDRQQEHNIEHVYTSFPEGKIQRQQIEIGGKTREQLQEELEQKGVVVNSYAKDMLKSPDFTTLPVAQMLDTVILKVEDLGLSSYPTTDQVYRKAQELGLDLCPPEVGPHMRLQTKDQPKKDCYWIGMKQIAKSDGYPNVFALERDRGGLRLWGRWAKPDDEWVPDDEFVFSLRKSAD